MCWHTQSLSLFDELKLQKCSLHYKFYSNVLLKILNKIRQDISAFEKNLRNTFKQFTIQKCCIFIIEYVYYKLYKFKLRAQKCFFTFDNSMYLTTVLTHCGSSWTYRFWRRKPSKHFETQTIEQLEIPTQKRCINFIIKFFYKLKIQIQTQSSKMLFLHLQFDVFTTVLTHFFVPSGHIFWRRKPSKHFETQTIEQLEIPTQKSSLFDELNLQKTSKHNLPNSSKYWIRF